MLCNCTLTQPSWFSRWVPDHDHPQSVLGLPDPSHGASRAAPTPVLDPETTPEASHITATGADSDPGTDPATDPELRLDPEADPEIGGTEGNALQ